MSFEVDCVIALRVPETPQGVAMLQALQKLHKANPDIAGLEALRALPAPAGPAFTKAFKTESPQRFRLFDFVARGPQAAFSLALAVDALDTTFVNLLLAFDAAGCRRIEATARADDLSRTYTCAAGTVEYINERDDHELVDDSGDDDE